MIAGAPRHHRDAGRERHQVGAAGRQNPGAGPRAARRPARRRVPRRHRGARHRARRRLPPRLGALRLRRRADGARGRLRPARLGPRADRGDRRGLRDQHLPGPRLRARPAPARLPSDQRGRAVRRRDGDRQAARARRAPSAPMRSASRRRARPGLFAFVNGGGDIKRLHAGHASREGMQAALLAEQGTEGPPNVIEARDGFMQAFAFGRIDKARPITLPPDGRVRHHRLLHQALRLLPAHPAGGRGDVRPVQRREHQVRGHQEGRGRDLQDRGRARARAVGRFRQRAIELSVPDGARGALPRRQVRALRREDAEGPGVRRVRAASSRCRRRPRSTSSIRSCARRASR